MGEKWPVSFACDFDFHVNPGFFDMQRKSATWETALLPAQGAMRKKNRHNNIQAKVKLFLCLIKHHIMKPFGRTKTEFRASTSALVRRAPSESDSFTAGKDLPTAQSKKGR